MTGCFARAIHQHRAQWRSVGIGHWESLESVTTHELLPGLLCQRRRWSGSQHTCGYKRFFYEMPATRMRVRVRSFLGDGGSVAQLRINFRIKLRKRMNDLLRLMFVDNLN
jgi:hypothetical protein